ncbi:hypothetical protein [Nocardioides marmotae]|uniref:hypothetical protein n=1 Tax=Nocardioides marmotae TaxID=2663857 RepID=UPI0012B5FBF3|nr:hypothetical protein [Nocardioides marmotae]MBC9734284.1 hypothetical protein [Nocardioides marmotae]MTB85385.1 hypothetical protein [Nocardioides marmotae]
MRRLLLLAAALAAAGGTVTSTLACTAQPQDLSAEALAEEVASLYPGAGDTRVDVRCEGPLAAEVGATRDCRVAVRRDVVTVRARVTEAGDAGPVFTTVPVVAADRVARTVLRGLGEDGYVVGEVVCAGDLLGVVGASVSCRAAPPDGEGRTEVEAIVRAVDGLDVRLRFRLAG